MPWSHLRGLCCTVTSLIMSAAMRIRSSSIPVKTNRGVGSRSSLRKNPQCAGWQSAGWKWPDAMPMAPNTAARHRNGKSRHQRHHQKRRTSPVPATPCSCLVFCDASPMQRGPDPAAQGHHTADGLSHSLDGQEEEPAVRKPLMIHAGRVERLSRLPRLSLATKACQAGRAVIHAAARQSGTRTTTIPARSSQAMPRSPHRDARTFDVYVFVPVQRVCGQRRQEVPLQVEHDRQATEKNFRVSALPAISSALSSSPQRTTRAQTALSPSIRSARRNAVSTGALDTLQWL